MKKFVKLPELKLKKETIAKLTKAKMKEVKGGATLKPALCQTHPGVCNFPLYGVPTDVD